MSTIAAMWDASIERTDAPNATDASLVEFMDAVLAARGTQVNVVEAFLAAAYHRDDLHIIGSPGYASEGRARAQAILRGESLEPPASVTEQLKACLFVLVPRATPFADSPESCRDVRAAAQRLLSTLVVEHPILMHPRVFVRVFHKDLADHPVDMPLAHAISLSTFGRFPFASDVLVGSPSGASIGTARLAQWVKTDLVHAAFTASAPTLTHTPTWLGGTRAVDCGLRTNHPNPAMLASVEQLWNLVKPEGATKNKFIGPDAPDLGTKTFNERGREVFVRGLAYALGLNATRTVVPEFLQLFRDQELMTFARVRPMFELFAAQAVFHQFGWFICHDDVADNTRHFCETMASAGLVDSPADAAKLLTTNIARDGIRSTSIPDIVGFIREVRVAGRPFPKGHWGPEYHLSTSAAKRDAWDSAWHICDAEDAMNAVLDRPRPVPANAGSLGNAADCRVPPNSAQTGTPPTRRRRAV